MLLSEELRKVSRESLPSCVDEKYREVESKLRGAARSAVMSCEVYFGRDESHLVEGVMARLRDQGLKVEMEEPCSGHSKLTVTWG